MTEQENDRRRVADCLDEAGVDDCDLYALEKDPETLERIAPVLLGLLRELHSPRVKTDLVRVISQARIPPESLVDELWRILPDLEHTPAASDSLSRLSGRELVAELSRIRAQSTGVAGLASALAHGLERLANESVYPALVEIIQDKRFGRARQALPYALSEVKSQRSTTIRVLIDLLNDEEVAAQAIDVLARMKAVEAVSAIGLHRKSKNRLIKGEVDKALKALERASPLHTHSSKSRPGSEHLVESSANFDPEDLPVLFDHIVALVDRCSSLDIERIESRLSELGPGEEEVLDFVVRYRGHETPLQVRIYMSDDGAPDVGFFSSPALAEAIDQVIDEFD